MACLAYLRVLFMLEQPELKNLKHKYLFINYHWQLYRPHFMYDMIQFTDMVFFQTLGLNFKFLWFGQYTSNWLLPCKLHSARPFLKISKILKNFTWWDKDLSKQVWRDETFLWCDITFFKLVTESDWLGFRSLTNFMADIL